MRVHSDKRSVRQIVGYFDSSKFVDRADAPSRVVSRLRGGAARLGLRSVCRTTLLGMSFVWSESLTETLSGLELIERASKDVRVLDASR